MDQSKGEFSLNSNQVVWQALIAGKLKEFNKTVALVGAAPVCDVVLTSPQAPWIAGALVRSTNMVEFVPTHEHTAHLACCLLPGGGLICCGDKIAVSFSATPPENHSWPSWPVVKILASNRISKVRLNRPAATLGNGFPSHIRTPSNILQKYSLLLIPQSGKLLIYALPKSGENSVQHLELKVGQKLTFKDVRIELLKIESSSQAFGHVISSPKEVISGAGIVVFEADRYIDHLAVKVSSLFQGRESQRIRLRVKFRLITGLVLTLTTLYFAWQLFKNMRPFL